MTIVIPYKTEVLNGEELKYALRSIEKNLTGWDRIVIISDNPPSWLKGVHFIFMGDIAGRKEYSVYQKLLHCCYVDNISENFIYWNDDHYLLKSLDVSEIRDWLRGTINSVIDQNKYFHYHGTLMNTLELVGNIPFYDLHFPMILNKQKFIERFRVLDKEICIKSYYKQWDTENSKIMEEGDFKMNACAEYENPMALIGDRLFFSTNGLTPDSKRVLQELFPEPSKFEL